MIPIDKGTQPDWNLRLGFPKLLNWFVGKSGTLYPTPGLNPLSSLPNSRACWYTPYNGGSYIVVTHDTIYRVRLSGGLPALISQIQYSGQHVQLAENLQNQITIVDGRKAYVLDQRNNDFIILDSARGFELETPCSVRVLNTITIILDKKTGTWIYSSANNALSYPALNTIPQIESQLTEAMGLETLNNNLYIFGSTGIERWYPVQPTNIYQPPFARDNNFRLDYGVISTGGYVRGKNVIYFLSSLYTFMGLEDNRQYELGAQEGKNQEGIAKFISQFNDVDKAIEMFYTFRSQTFAQWTFPNHPEGWVWNVDSSTFHNVDDFIIDAPDNIEVVLTKDGLFTLSITPSHKHRQWRGPRVKMDKNTDNFRSLHRGVEVELVQGYQHLGVDERLEYSYSITGGTTWSNRISKPIGATGNFQARTRFPLNKACYEFIPQVDYYGSYDLTIERIKTNID